MEWKELDGSQYAKVLLRIGDGIDLRAQVVATPKNDPDWWDVQTEAVLIDSGSEERHVKGDYRLKGNKYLIRNAGKSMLIDDCHKLAGELSRAVRDQSILLAQLREGIDSFIRRS